MPILADAAIELKFPSSLIIRAGAISVSNQSSPEGDNVICPVQFERRTGVTLSVRVAYGCSIATTSV